MSSCQLKRKGNNFCLTLPGQWGLESYRRSYAVKRQNNEAFHPGSQVVGQQWDCDPVSQSHGCVCSKSKSKTPTQATPYKHWQCNWTGKIWPCQQSPLHQHHLMGQGGPSADRLLIEGPQWFPYSDVQLQHWQGFFWDCITSNAFESPIKSWGAEKRKNGELCLQKLLIPLRRTSAFQLFLWRMLRWSHCWCFRAQLRSARGWWSQETGTVGCLWCGTCN